MISEPESSGSLKTKRFPAVNSSQINVTRESSEIDWLEIPILIPLELLIILMFTEGWLSYLF